MSEPEKDNTSAQRVTAMYHVTDMLHQLQDYWMRRPHLRLAQIVSNAWRIHPDYKRNPEPDINDVFYFTNEKFLEGLKLLIENESKDSRPAQN
jgi:hypothetical protein